MTKQIIDSEIFRDMIKMGVHRLNKNVDFINSLNVFPVPDGDTGTNMNLTFQSGAKFVNESSSNSVGELAVTFSKGLLMGARGNSGVISSQIFRGFQKEIATKESINASDFVAALKQGVDSAYKAVMKPVEGTILTVAKYAAQSGIKAVAENDDLENVMSAVVEGAKIGLKKTPDLLPVLKEVGVVDSGGQGLVFLYEGFLNGIKGEVKDDIYTPSDEQMNEMVNAAHHQSIQSQLATNDIEYGYCTEMMIDLDSKKAAFNLAEFRNYLNKLGNSLLAVSDDEVAKVHIHTEHPGAIFAYGSQFGQLGKIKIDNMRIQHETIVNNSEENQENVDFAVIAVASGNGIRKLFESEGVNRIISGGQTMNPSTQDIIDSIKKSGAKKAIVMPNNGNIIMAAKQAAEVSDIPVGIVPTKTIAQGLTAMLSFDADDSLEDNVANMTDALDTVVSGEVTKANRDTTINEVEIHQDDYLGIVDGDIKIANTDLITTASSMVEKMLDEDSEIITVIYGRDSNKKEAQELVEAVKEKHDDLEFEIHDGGQPVYNFLISVE